MLKNDKILFLAREVRHDFKSSTYVSFIPFFVFGFGNKVTKIQKHFAIFVYILQEKMANPEKKRKENHATKVAKILKTKR